ncbi:uncharacterized protein M6B38_264175 [Iris pallida]|uniref:Uncharacterized protein n=1 Tax=Iris pallida TaxID=29817 RepID=A0AAX6ID07_IRIPA|nr:uncharacterized protein M6B38_264175 [Iris pallida]
MSSESSNFGSKDAAMGNMSMSSEASDIRANLLDPSSIVSHSPYKFIGRISCQRISLQRLVLLIFYLFS